MVSPRKFIGLILAGAALVIAAGSATSRLVAFNAEETAQSQPYCIQVADRTSDYRPARSWLDLSALTMWARREGPLYMQHHAILVVGEGENRRLYYWSYRQRSFEPEVLNGQIMDRGPAVTCLPVHDFVSKQLVLFPKSSDTVYVKFSAQRAYRIPNAWQVKWSGGANPTLRLATTAPDFQPLNQRWRDLAREEHDSNWVFIAWDPEWVLSLMKAEPSGNIVEQSTEFGLAKSKTLTHGKDGKEYIGYRYLVYADDRDINTTVIDCATPSEAFPKSCQHRFINRGRHFYFRHRPEDVANWRGMQARILELMDSFEVHDGASPHG